MDQTFKALASSVRRSILDILNHSPGLSVGELCWHFEISRIAVIKHLKVLQDADLVISSRQGRQRLLYFNAVPIQGIYDRWTTEFSAIWTAGLTALKYRVENPEEE